MSTFTTYSPPIFFNQDRLAYLKRYAPEYPSINRFESALETRGLIEFTTTFRFRPDKDSNTYSPSIYAYKVKGVYFIQSFQTIVGAICLNPHIFPAPIAFRFWDGNSRTTSKHVHLVSWKLSGLMVMNRRYVPYPDVHGPVADIYVLLNLLADAKDFDPQKYKWPHSLH